MDSTAKGKLALLDAKAFNAVMLRYSVDAVVPVGSPKAMREHCKVFPAGGCFYHVKVMGSTKFNDVMRLEREVKAEIAAERKRQGLYERTMSVRFNSEPFLVLEVDPPPGFDLLYEPLPLQPLQAAVGMTFGIDGAFPMLYDLNVHHQTLVAAVSGHGKSRLLRNCVSGIARTTGPDKVKLSLIDFKNDDLSKFQYLPHTISYAWRTEEANSTIYAIRDEVEKRIAQNGKRKKNKSFPDKHLLVIDEGAELDKELDDTLASIMKLGRSLGVHVLLATQYPTSAQIGQKVSQAFTHRMVGRVSSASSAAWATGMGESGAELLRKQGSFLYVFGGEITRFQTFNLTEAQEDNGE